MMAGQKIVRSLPVLLLALVGAALAYWQFVVWGPIAAVRPVRGVAVDAVSATATVQPRRWSEVAPLRSGRIVEVLFNEGVRIDTGAPLARMDDSDLRVQLAEAQSTVAFRRAELARTENPTPGGAPPPQTLDARQSALEKALARQRMLEEQIQQMTIVAPINGMILWRNVNPGDVIQSGQTVFWIGEPQPLRLEAEVSETDMARIRKNQKVLITASAFSGQALYGTIDSVTPKGEPGGKSYRVFASLPEDTPLTLGMRVEADIVVGYAPDAVLVPVSAFHEGAVWTAQRTASGAYEARKTPVVPGTQTPTALEIREGIGTDTLVLVSPPAGLTDGAALSVREVAWVPRLLPRLEAALSHLVQAGGDPAPRPAAPPLPTSGSGGGCGQTFVPPAGVNPGDDKYTKLRKEWQSRGTCFPNIAPPPPTAP